MKVLQIAYRSNVAGGEMVLLQLTNNLRDEGHFPAVLCPETGKLTELLSQRDIRFFVIPMRTTYSLSAARAIRSLIERERFDLVHSHGLLVNVLGRLAVAGTKTPLVCTVHLTRDLKHHPWLPSPLTALKWRFYYRFVDNWTRPYSSRTIAVSRAVREDLINQGYPADHIVVISNGIDPAPFDRPMSRSTAELRTSLGAGSADVLVGMVARLSPQKAVDCFLRALSLTSDSTPRVRAFIAGDGPERDRLERLSRELDVAERCRFLGFRDDVPDLLRACDIFALSSRWEGLPLSVLEAMAASKPVVATDVPGTAEAVVPDETGILCPIDDWRSFGAGLLSLATDASRRETFGANGRRRLDSEFSSSRVVRQHLQLYTELLLREGRHP